MQTLIHIGAGTGTELANYQASQADQIILIEPQPALAKALSKATATDKRFTIIEAAIAPTGSEQTLKVFNLPELSSLYEPTGIKNLYPGLKQVADTPFSCLSPTELLEQHLAPNSTDNHLVIDAPGAEAGILKALIDQNQLKRFATLQLACPAVEYYDTNSHLSTIKTLLEAYGYQTTQQSNNDPDWPTLSCTLSPLKVQYDEQSQALATAQNDAQKNQQQATKLKQELEALSKDHQQAQIELDQAKAQQAELKKQNQSLKESLTKSEEKNLELQKKLEDAQKAHSKQKSQAETNQKELKATSDQHQQLKEQHSALKQKHETTAKAHEAQKTELAELNKELSNHKEWLSNRKKELEDTRKALEAAQAELKTAKEHNASLETQNQQNQEELQQLKKRRDQLKKELEQSKTEQSELQASEEKARQKYSQLEQQLKQLQEQNAKEQGSGKAFKALQERMEYLFDQNTLQLEQAANALGHHVSNTVQSSARELEAGIALQQQYGSELPSLEETGYRLPSTVALRLAKQLKDQPYDLIIEMGSGVSTTFMAQTLRSHNGAGQSRQSSENNVARYIDPSEDDLPKRIICFEHNRQQYNKLKSTLKQSPLAAMVTVQFAPLVNYSHQGKDLLFYDCAQKLQHIGRLFEDREAKIFILINPTGSGAHPELAAALPQLLQYLSAHSLDIVANVGNQPELISQWQSFLEQRALAYQNASDFGNQNMKLLRVNSN